MRVTVLVPAHNEEATVVAAVASLRAQTRTAESIMVVADNCTDHTVALARMAGARVFETQGNQHKKAGALNQALGWLLPRLGSDDAVLVMDADSALDSRFIANGITRLERGYGACGGVFTGQPGGGLVGMFQRNEFARYARDVKRLRGRALVLTGTATLFRADVLKAVVAARIAGRLPGEAAVYDTRVLTEDNELTFALLHLGVPILAPADCALTTEVMTSWRALHQQRLRWKRGALENLFDYGWTPVTRRYWGRQALSAAGVLVTGLYAATIIWALATSGSLNLQPFWLWVSLVFVAEQTITVRSRGKVQMALASVLIIEMVYDLFLQMTQARALWQTATRAERSW